MSFIALVAIIGAGAHSQDFGPQQTISSDALGARSVYAADLDGDGDLDVLSASTSDNKVAWYENQGGGVFGPQAVITTAADAAWSVYATDTDNDGDMDVLSSSINDGKIAWYENQGGGVFGTQQVIWSGASGPNSVYATDLDGDGDMDVLSAALIISTGWYENLGMGVFSAQKVIGPNNKAAHADDVDGDGRADVLTITGTLLSWHQNLGGGAFGPQQVITNALDGGEAVYSVDLDGDTDRDVLSASMWDGKIAWYRNLGGGAFGPQQVITVNAMWANSVYASDLDGDGDADVLSASRADDKIAWYENQGNGVFGTQQVITTSADFATDVFASDVDGDGDLDVLSASSFDGKIAWYENLMNPFDCNGNGIADSDEILNDPSLDWNGDGVLDSCASPNYCTANPNTTGFFAAMSASGSPLIVDNNFTITASQMPTFEFGYFLMANSQGFIPNVGGSAGNLCLGTPIYRFVKPPTGTILSSGPGGTFSFAPNLLNLPQGVVFQVGETWDFQAWFRDGAGSTSNFTDGIAVLFR